jgi:deoxyadenosine/deoxycytidine kinase
MSPEQFETYELLYQDFMDDVRAPALMVFVDVAPDVALQRVRSRARGAESGLCSRRPGSDSE